MKLWITRIGREPYWVSSNYITSALLVTQRNMVIAVPSSFKANSYSKYPQAAKVLLDQSIEQVRLDICALAPSDALIF